MIEPKQKPVGKPVHTAEKARLPRTAMRAVWLRTREGTRRLAAEERQEGQYREAASLEERAVDTAVSAAESAVGSGMRDSKKLAQYIAQNRKKAHSDATAVHEQTSSAAAGEPRSPQAGQTPYYKGRRGYAGLTRQSAGQNVGTSNTDVPDVHQSRLRHDSLYRFKVTTRRKPQPRQASAPKTATTAVGKIADTNKVRKTAANAARRAKQAAQAAREATQKLADAVMAGLKALWASTQTLVAAITAGGAAAVFVVIIICMIALVVGSAFGIFFAGESTGTGITVQEAIIQLNGEYQDRLEAEGPHPVLCQLIALRRQEPAFQSSEIQFLPGEGRLVRYRRGEPGPGQLEVCLNAGRQPEAVGPGGADLFALAWDGETLAPGGILIRRV